MACKADERASIRNAFGLANNARVQTLLQRGLPPRSRALQFLESPDQTRDENAMPIALVEGGVTRQDSVLNAVRAAKSDWVLVHDAARPCVSRALIESVLQAATATGAAIAALPVSDTVKRAARDGSIHETLNRDEIWLAQTPQIFRREPFLAALESAHSQDWQGTDCASIMERAGHQVALVKGEAENLKVTYASDLERAATILAR